MQEYKSLLGTNLSEGLIESDFEVDHYGSLHTSVVTPKTLLLLRHPEVTFRPLLSFLPPLSCSLSFFIFPLRIIPLANASMLLPYASLRFPWQGFDLALVTDGFFARNDQPHS